MPSLAYGLEVAQVLGNSLYLDVSDAVTLHTERALTG